MARQILSLLSPWQGTLSNGLYTTRQGKQVVRPLYRPAYDPSSAQLTARGVYRWTIRQYANWRKTGVPDIMYPILPYQLQWSIFARVNIPHYYKTGDLRQMILTTGIIPPISLLSEYHYFPSRYISIYWSVANTINYNPDDILYCYASSTVPDQYVYTPLCPVSNLQYSGYLPYPIITGDYVLQYIVVGMRDNNTHYSHSVSYNS